MATIELKDTPEQMQDFQIFAAFLKSYDSTLIPAGFAKVGDATPAATLNHAYLATETGTVFGVSAEKGQLLVGNGTAFEAMDVLQKANQVDVTVIEETLSQTQNELEFAKSQITDLINYIYSSIYEVESIAFFSRLSTPISFDQRENYNNLIKSLKNAGVWDKRDAIWVFGTYLQEYALLNLKADAHNATVVGSPTFTVGKGFKNNGSTANYLRMGFNPAVDAFKLQANDTGVTLVYQNTSELTGYIFGASNGIDKNFFIQQNNTSKIISYTGGSVYTPIINKKIYSYNVKPSGIINIFSDKYKHVMNGHDQGLFPDLELFALSSNRLGSSYIGTNLEISAIAIGGALTEEEARAETDAFDAFLSAQGTGVLSERVDNNVIILSGQSNAMGAWPEDILPSGWNEEQDNIKISHWFIGATYLLRQMNPLTNAGIDYHTTENNGWGCEQTASHELLDSSGKDVIIIKNAYNGAAISNWNDANNDAMFTLRKQILEVINAQYLYNYNLNAVSMVWLQGESDVATNKTVYKEKLQWIIDQVRSYNEFENIQFVMCELPDIQTAVAEATKTKINEVFAETATEKINCVVLSPDDIAGIAMNDDNLHYSAASQLLIGTAWYNLMT